MKGPVALPAIAVITFALCSPAVASEIHDAAAAGALDAVKALVTADPELINARDARRMTPLHLAARGVHADVVRYLVAHGADVSAKDANGVTALHSLSYRGAAELVALLIARGADPDATLADDRAAIHLAVAAGHTAVVEALLKNGVDVNSANASGSTPLLLAASAGFEKTVALLIAHGASVDQRNSRGDTPLSVAAREGHSSIVELLAARGADPASAAKLTRPVGPYLGQKPPGASAVPFAPRVVSTERDQLNAVFSPDGREFYYTQVTAAGSVIMMMQAGDDGWSRPQPAPFSGGLRDVDHFMTRDGLRMLFCSMRATEEGGEARRDADFWVAERTRDGWGEPRPLSPVVNSNADDYYPTLADDGTLLFSSRRPGGFGESDLYRARFENGEWAAPENLGAPVNTEHTEHDPFIAPDGSYLIFASDRPGGYGLTDLYISFARPDGQWDEPRNMGSAVNSEGRDFTPMLSQDGKYLFFTSTRAGAEDLYWVDHKVIEQTRPEPQPG